MCGDAVVDARGVVHNTHSIPQPFIMTIGGVPGNTWCGVLFYDNALGPGSCTMVGIKHPYAVPMTRTEAPVNCMSCLVRACR